MDLRLKLLAETHRRERRRPSRPTRISEAKKLTGLVVTMKADRTVGVEVVRLARHPKFHRRDCIKKAHDSGNRFKPSGPLGSPFKFPVREYFRRGIVVHT
jgi:hypothetical protein